MAGGGIVTFNQLYLFIMQLLCRLAYTQAELIALIRWILSDSCLRTDEEILREMVLELGFKRRGARIDKAVQAAIKRMGSSR